MLENNYLIFLFLFTAKQCFVFNMVIALQALTEECVLTKFEKTRCALLESLHQLEETLPEAINSQVFTGHVQMYF